jgi:hypothetical protein
MVFFRWLVGLLGVAAILCFAMYIGTSELKWRHRGVLIVKWTVMAALAFFAVLIVERLVTMP